MTESLIAVAIEELSPSEFEQFAQAAVQIVYGPSFEPTGGMHDGGLDGYLRSADEPGHYMQASKERQTSSKIRRTIQRIRETRDLQKLTYVTSQVVQDKEFIESKIRKDLGVPVVIHGNTWLATQCRLYSELKKLLFSLSHAFMETVRSIQEQDSDLLAGAKLSIVSYLELEASSLDKSEDFQVLCLDSVIYEALEGTDPEAGSLITEEEIRLFIEQQYPTVLSKSKHTLVERLEYLSSKMNDPRIRKHPGAQYGLPYDVRYQFSEKNEQINSTEDAFVSSVHKRLNADQLELPEYLKPYIFQAIRRVVIETYQQQAMNFIASFHKMQNDNRIRVFDFIEEFLGRQPLADDEREVCSEAAATIVRNIFYSSNSDERAYIALLMKYFSIHFLMSGDETVQRYFSEMAKRLRLYIGSDIIVRMLSETLIKPQSRAMTNTIQMLVDSGVQVYLTRQVVSEVYHHLCSTHSEFQSDHAKWWRHIQLDESKNFDKILVRAFYYAVLEPEKHVNVPKDWGAFMSNFGNPAWYDRDARSEDEFGSLLVGKFKLKFVEDTDITDNLDEYVFTKLTNKILELREQIASNVNRQLAENDAAMMLFINEARKRRNERVGSDIYGMSTWWLTEETTVLRAAREINTADNSIMNPQFLVNHYFLESVSKSRSIAKAADELALPTTFGLRITDRATRDQMDAFVSEISDLDDLDDAAQSARIRAAANKLKSRKKISGNRTLV